MSAYMTSPSGRQASRQAGHVACTRAPPVRRFTLRYYAYNNHTAALQVICIYEYTIHDNTIWYVGAQLGRFMYVDLWMPDIHISLNGCVTVHILSALI